MKRLITRNHRALLAIALLTLTACEPVGSPSSEPAPPAMPTGQRVPGLPGQVAAPTAGVPALPVSEKAEIYALAAGIEPDRLAEAIDDALQKSDPGRRTLLVAALTERLAEIDPSQALQAATAPDVDVPRELLVALFTTVAGEDPESAIEALARLRHRRTIDVIHPLATIVLEKIRTDSALLEAWMQAVPSSTDQSEELRRRPYLPDLRAQGFQVLTEANPDLVLDRIVTMSERELLVVNISQLAAILAKHDVRTALARVETARDPGLRKRLHYQLLRSWAADDPIAALSYLASLDSWDEVPSLDRDYITNETGMRELARDALASGADPMQLLTFAQQLPIDRAREVRFAAVSALARRDPVAASHYLDEIPANARQGIIGTIANGYVALDPSSAFQWAQQQSPEVEQQVLMQIAYANPAMALDFALDATVRARDAAITTVVVQSIRRQPQEAPLIAARLTQALGGSALYEGAIASLAGEWVQRDTEAAVAWLASPGAPLPSAAYQAAARALNQDPSRAAALADRMPPGGRSVWIENVAANYVRNNIDGAIAWIEAHRSDPEYAGGAVAVVQQVAQYSPRRAAEVFENLPGIVDPQRLRQAAGTLSAAWVRSDPRAAAAWAIGLRDEAARSQAMMNITRNWSQQDPDATQSWIMSQPVGPDRDQLIQAHLSATSVNELPRPELFEGFSTEEALFRSMSGVIGNPALSDPAAARAWLDSANLPAAIRQRVEVSLAQVRMLRERAPEMRNSLILVPPIPPVSSPER